jgi:hypothetical protein
MTNIDQRLNGTPIPKAYVAFVDVLGSRKRINELFNKSMSLEHIVQDPFIQALDAVRELANRPIEPGHGDERPLITAFSDSAILYAPSTLSGLEFILEAAWLLTHKLLPKGVFVRGAITYGQVIRLRDLTSGLIGPAFNEVVDLEKAAVYPRIILSPSIATHVRAALKKNSALLRSLLRVSADGFIHVRPVDSIKHNTEDGQKRKIPIETIIADAEEAIVSALKDDRLSDKERAKLVWLANEVADCGVHREVSFDDYEASTYPLVRRTSLR